MTKNYTDLITGFILMALSILMFVTSFSIQALTDSLVGAGFMPRIIAILMAVMSIPVIVSGFKPKKIVEIEDDSILSDEDLLEVKEEKSENGYIYLVLTVTLLIIYFFFIPIVGFLIATAAYLIAQMLLFSEWSMKNIVLYAVISIVTSSIIYFVFKNVFYVMLPAGILG